MMLKRDIPDQIVAVTSRESCSQAEVYEQFGRTYWLLFYNPKTKKWNAFDNEKNRNLKIGAGEATARVLLNVGAGVVLTGETGPKAFRALSEAGICVVQNVNGRVDEALQDWLSGRLPTACRANDSGSPNCLLVGSSVEKRAEKRVEIR